MFEQTLIPRFPDDALNVGKALSILEKDGRVTYFVGGDDYFSHPSGDAAARRLALATLMENGDVRPVDLTGEPLFIPQRTLMNWAAQLRRDGAQSFFRAAPPRRPRVINETVGASGATLLAEGLRPSEVARHAGIEESTLRNAIRRKAVPELPKSPECADGSAASTAQCLGTTLIAGRMFSRWCQESCFAYMMQHYDLDGLIHSTAPTPKKVRLDRLPEEQRPNALRPLGKRLADAVKMIAYRAETAKSSATPKPAHG